jgi:L-alanine-DL-glutamate epimerase-like enolase superfamily enzyme
MNDQSRYVRGEVVRAVQMLNIDMRYPRTIGKNAVLGDHGAALSSAAAVISTADGAVGWGLVTGGPHSPESLIGRRLDDLITPEVGIIDESAMWADYALHDLVGVLSGEPAHTTLGGAGERRVPSYDASIYFDDLAFASDARGVEVVLENVRAGWADGHRAFKLKIGRGFTWMEERDGLKRDVEVTRAVREAFPEATLLVDANNGFTVEGAIRYLDQVADVGLYWIEEPFNEHRNGLERLRTWLNDNRCTTLVADGEYRPDVAEVVRFAREGLIDVLLMDSVEYGLTPWRRLSRALEGSNVQISPHAWGQPLKTFYAAQIAAGFGNVPIVEGVRGTVLGVDTSAYSIVDGVLTVPAQPGFGLPAPEVRR